MPNIQFSMFLDAGIERKILIAVCILYLFERKLSWLPLTMLFFFIFR